MRSSWLYLAMSSRGVDPVANLGSRQIRRAESLLPVVKAAESCPYPTVEVGPGQDSRRRPYAALHHAEVVVVGPQSRDALTG